MTAMTEHCWHFANGYTNGSGTEGSEVLSCCYCGKYGRRSWTRMHDQQHGPFQPQFAQPMEYGPISVYHPFTDDISCKPYEGDRAASPEERTDPR